MVVAVLMAQQHRRLQQQKAQQQREKKQREKKQIEQQKQQIERNKYEALSNKDKENINYEKFFERVSIKNNQINREACSEVIKNTINNLNTENLVELKLLYDNISSINFIYKYKQKVINFKYKEKILKKIKEFEDFFSEEYLKNNSSNESTTKTYLYLVEKIKNTEKIKEIENIFKNDSGINDSGINFSKGQLKDIKYSDLLIILMYAISKKVFLIIIRNLKKNNIKNIDIDYFLIMFIELRINDKNDKINDESYDKAIKMFIKYIFNDIKKITIKCQLTLNSKEIFEYYLDKIIKYESVLKTELNINSKKLLETKETLIQLKEFMKKFLEIKNDVSYLNYRYNVNNRYIKYMKTRKFKPEIFEFKNKNYKTNESFNYIIKDIKKIKTYCEILFDKKNFKEYYDTLSSYKEVLDHFDLEKKKLDDFKLLYFYIATFMEIFVKKSYFTNFTKESTADKYIQKYGKPEFINSINSIYSINYFNNIYQI